MSFLVIAHRGASGTCPENTLSAFRRAAALGAHMIELDVQLSRDGAVVVMHDWTLDRTTTGTGPVGERTLAELRALDAGAWFDPARAGERVPTLAEVLAAVPLPINVELKPRGNDGLEAQALAVARQTGSLGRIVFSSFDRGVLERLRSLTPEAGIALVLECPVVAEDLAWAGRVGARALHVRKEAVTPGGLLAAASGRLPVRVWTVNEQSEMAHLRTVGVDGIFTDHPERFLQNVPGE